LLSRSTTDRFADREVVEEHLRIRLRPQAASSRRRRLDLSLQTLLTVQNDRERTPMQRGVQGMPRSRRRLNSANGVEYGALAANDAKEEQVVLQSVCASAEVAAVWRDAPRKARSLVDSACLWVETDRQRQIVARTVVLVDRKGEVGERLHPVEEFGVPVTPAAADPASLRGASSFPRRSARPR